VTRSIPIAVLTTLIVAACSSDRSPSQGGATPSPKVSTQQVTFHTEGGPGPASAVQETGAHLKFVNPKLSASGPEIQIHFMNGEQPTTAEIKRAAPTYPWKHDLKVTDAVGNIIAGTQLLKAGKEVVLVVDGLESGAYPFYCSVHVGLGVKGTLTVT
jgi:Copper binding proteins, plastocyanin/azurin family